MRFGGIIFILLCVVTQQAQSNSVVDISYENLKMLLEKNNLQVSAAQDEVEAAERKTGSFSRSFIPDIEITAAHETFKEGQNPTLSQPQFSAEAILNIYNGGIDRITGSIHQYEFEAAKFQYDLNFAAELKKARETYWNLMYLKEYKLLLTEIQQLNKKTLASAIRRINSGVASASDRYEFEMKEIEIRQQIKEAELAEKRTLRELAILLNLTDVEKINVTGSFTHDHNFEESIKHSPKDHEFNYKSLELTAAKANLGAESERSRLLPRVDLFARYSAHNQLQINMPNAEDRTEQVSGIKLTFNLSDAVENYKSYSSGRLAASAASKRLSFNKKEIESHVENEIEELDFYHQRVHDSKDQISIAEKYFKSTLSEYERGVKNSPDVLSAGEKLFNTRKTGIEIIRDFQIAKSHILSKIGK